MAVATDVLNSVGVTKWTRANVAAYGRAMEKAFPGLRVAGQCRANNVRPPGGAANSLHYVKNGCRALDFDTKYPSGSNQEDRLLLAVEQWAEGTGAFQETIYSEETGFHRTLGANNHFHLGFPKSGPAPDPGKGFTPVGLTPAGLGGEQLIAFLRDLGTSVAAVIGGFLLVILGVYLIARDQGVV